ncbi:putative transcription factor WD40-like family [Medicago truncatula]|uniref:Putative transcription factor WD40-like family n=1 Tax=Medicago truncatula TaxID=3880 RepID=A0A396I5D8_MEDTR|nr:putative transcription factor WD40-like family [Medicago truncatula]
METEQNESYAHQTENHVIGCSLQNNGKHVGVDLHHEASDCVLAEVDDKQEEQEHLKLTYQENLIPNHHCLASDNCGSPGYDPTLCGDEDNTLLELSGEAVSDDAYARKSYITDSVEAELHLQGTSQIDQKGESSDCDWDGIIPNSANMLIEAEAFKGLMQKPSGSPIQLQQRMSQQIDEPNAGSIHDGQPLMKLEFFPKECVATKEVAAEESPCRTLILFGTTLLVKDPPDLVPALPLPLAPPWLVTEAIKQAITIAASVAEAVTVDFQSQSLPTKSKASVISSSDIAKLCVPTPPPKHPDPWFSTTMGKSYIVGEIAKPLIQTAVDFQVKKIPETFNSSTDYKNYFMPPLLEETHSDLYSNSLGVSPAPFCEVTKVERDNKQFKLPKSLFYQISFKSTKEYNSKYEPEPGYLIAFTNIKPKRVDFVNHIFCNLLPPVNLITNSFSQCQTFSCHGIPLDDAGKKLNPFSCPVTGSNMETCDVYENYVCVGGKTILFLPSFHNLLKLLPIYSPINITVTKRINLASLDEGVIMGVSFVVTPFPYHVIETNFDDTDQSDMHAQLFQGLSSVLHSMDQGLMCSSSCDLETVTEAVENSSLITDVRFSASMPRHSTSVMSLDFHPNKDDLICSCDGDVVRLLHALCDLSSRDSKFEQIFFDDIKVATQMIEMVFFTLTVLAGYIQEGHAAF